MESARTFQNPPCEGGSRRHHFLGIPPELRLVIYEIYLDDHRRVHNSRQPTNRHLRLLLTCHQVYGEAREIFHRYVSLRNEREIESFLSSVADERTAQITYADVANDGRVEQTKASYRMPISGLHSALWRMKRLQHLRVFHYEATPFLSLYQVSRTKWTLQSEEAMYPGGCPAHLLSYELYVNPEAKVQLLERIPSRGLQRLRLSGSCQLLREQQTPGLRHLTIHGVTGSYFDQRRLDDCFQGALLESFVYGMGHRLGFEIRNHHLLSLASGSRPQHLRKLVLLGCSRLTSEVITRCLSQLNSLEYLAMSLVTVDELRHNFVAALPPTVSVFKLTVTNAWYSIPLIKEETALCDTIENSVLVRKPSPIELRFHFRPSLMSENGREKRWQSIAEDDNVNLVLGPWEPYETL
ncbi:hypothetical protein OE88DRAFT_1650826 [Heliocybe sulcata]|uniref:F-box domain-containing protein n=1 Tax=Heliocybe sulcata TaxID=5364 RepID=A0A5C3NL50_9AGAM|nr:hypothetical protein OE88DRAFT_1650826 [Heliocybe sulcata]